MVEREPELVVLAREQAQERRGGATSAGGSGREGGAGGGRAGGGQAGGGQAGGRQAGGGPAGGGQTSGGQAEGRESRGAEANNNPDSNQDSEERHQSSSQDDMTEELSRKIRRERNRKRKRGDDDEDDMVEARMPRDLLKKTALLASKLGLSVRQHLTLVMGVYELSGWGYYSSITSETFYIQVSTLRKWSFLCLLPSSIEGAKNQT